jgi:hypothetical protein
MCWLNMPQEVITRVAQLGKSDVIVIGSRGLGQTLAVLLGNVSAQVIHSAECPMLVIKRKVRGIQVCLPCVTLSALRLPRGWRQCGWLDVPERRREVNHVS